LKTVTTDRDDTSQGAWIAAGVLALWSVAQLGSVALADRLPAALWIPTILLETFLYTGLFITAHDGMHGSIAPRHPRLNDALGTLCTALYALFSFRRMRAAHRKHHANPGTAADPDFAREGRHEFWRWYVEFFKAYFSWYQIAGMTVLFQLLHRAVGVDAQTLIVFWVVPSLLSTLQLFYFGTYLPHREPEGGHDNPHRARSNDYSELVSFLTCYHFGYHLEHHEHPHVPWWKLPAARSARSRAAD
jgi:beta-carotene ketolase (CrtW type)